MIKFKLILLSCLIALVTLTSCAGSPYRTGREANKNRQSLLKLHVGMNKEEVLQIMGEPRSTEAYFVDEERNVIEFWLYMTEGVKVSDRTLRDSNFTPLAFENNLLVGWGRNFYDKTIKFEHKVDVKSGL